MAKKPSSKKPEVSEEELVTNDGVDVPVEFEPEEKVDPHTSHPKFHKFKGEKKK